ncbi:unnamed protein product [Eruca vesicaria subsp. sativa]|uniref:Uncharacterized protein n=1 Tax=Eruca vesicaria subsp. sativa TaxID=29727 RepID=A0ABC8KFA3_ERUVS|nr:unnamed protein product [Eruca vesicaria subsp. sativa]
MVLDAGGVARRRHRHSSPLSVLAVFWLLVMSSPSTPLLCSCVSSTVHLSVHHRLLRCATLQGCVFVTASSVKPFAATSSSHSTIASSSSAHPIVVASSAHPIVVTVFHIDEWRNAGAATFEGGLTRSGPRHLLVSVRNRPDLPTSMLSPECVIIGRETISRSHHHDPLTFPSIFDGCFSSSTIGFIVQECCFARFVQFYFIDASLSHYAVSSIDGSSQNRFCCFLGLFVADLTVQEGELAGLTSYIIVASPSQYAVSSIDGLSQCQLSDFRTGVVSNQSEVFYLLSDVCSHTFCLDECDDSMLRFLVTNYSTRYGNIEFRGLNLFQPLAMSSNFLLSASLEAKLELEIHLVSSVSLVGFKAVYANFSVISSQIGLRSLNVAYGSRASHLRFSTVNILAASFRCFNVVFDYQLFFRAIAMGTKVKLPFGFLHFAEHVSPRDGFIFTYFVMFSSFVLPSSIPPFVIFSPLSTAPLVVRFSPKLSEVPATIKKPIRKRLLSYTKYVAVYWKKQRRYRRHYHKYFDEYEMKETI